MSHPEEIVAAGFGEWNNSNTPRFIGRRPAQPRARREGASPWTALSILSAWSS